MLAVEPGYRDPVTSWSAALRNRRARGVGVPRLPPPLPGRAGSGFSLLPHRGRLRRRSTIAMLQRQPCIPLNLLSPLRLALVHLACTIENCNHLERGSKIVKANHVAKNRFLNTATVLLTVLAIAVVGWRFKTVTEVPLNLPDVETVPDWGIYAQGGLRTGAHDTPVTVVEFLDLYCSVCKRAASYVAALPDRFPTNVSVVYRHYPFLTPGSVEAGAAVACAHEQGLMEQFMTLVYDNLPTAGAEAWTALFGQLHAGNQSSFASCISSDATVAVVMQDTILARRLGVDGTPTFLVNDQKIVGFHGADVMDHLIEATIREAERAGDR